MAGNNEDKDVPAKNPTPQVANRQPAEHPWIPTFKAWASGLDTVLVVDAAGKVLRLNKPLGSVTPMELRSHSIWEWTSDVNTTKLRAAIRHAFHPGVSQVLEADFPSGEGRRWYRIQAIRCGDEAERAVLLHCVDIDDTHRELVRLRDGERLMRDGEGLAHLGTWYWDITQPHATWSDQLYEIYGLDPKTHTPTYEDYLTRIHPGDVERVKFATERVFNDFEPYSHDERIRHTDGTWRHLHTWARPVLHDDGTLKALQGVCLDITQRKESELALASTEARQRLILDYAGLGIASIAADGRMEQGNSAFDALTGSAAMLRDRFDEPVLIDNSIDRLMAGKDASLTIGVVPTHQPEHHVRLLLTRVTDEAAAFIVAVAQDVTAEVLARQADEKIRDLEARYQTHARVVGVAGHELKNPITPMLMQLALLERGSLGPLDERQAGALAKIHRQTVRIQSLLQDLLDTSKAGAGALAIDKEHIDVAALVRNATDAHQATADSFDVVLVADTPEHLQAMADPGRLIQVVDNLVINAIRFTPSGRRVDVVVEDQGDSWRLQVIDEGVGIPAEQQEDIFDAFVRGDTPAAHDVKSSGLGLYVVRGIVEAHGGTIAVASSSSNGTTLSAVFPK